MNGQPISSQNPRTPIENVNLADETFTRLPETDIKGGVNATEEKRLRLRGRKDKGINARIMQEVGKFDDPVYGQSLRLISKKLQISKQNLNNHLRRLAEEGLIKRLPGGSNTRYELTESGRGVNVFLVQSENPAKTAIGGDCSRTPEKTFTAKWRYHNLLVGFRVVSWGTWKFTQLTPMMNWSYQAVKVPPHELVAHVQTTGLIKIYAPEAVGTDPEELRIQAAAQAQEAARWFVDRYDMSLEGMKVLRKGEKELMKSEALARLFGRVKTEGFFVNASGGDENLEEPDDSVKIEKMMIALETTPERLARLEDIFERKMSPVLLALAEQIELHLRATREWKDSAVGIRDTAVDIRDALRQLLQSGVIRPRNPEPAVDDPIDGERVQVEFTRFVPPFRATVANGSKDVGPFNPAARMYFVQGEARRIVNEGLGRIVG